MKPCIFVLDDDPSVVEVTQLILENEGYDVVVGYSESDLYENLQKKTPDLILMDIWLAQADGGQITKKLKADDKLRHIHIILFSALSEIQSLSVAAGADGFLRKPYDMTDLVDTVKKFVNGPSPHTL